MGASADLETWANEFTANDVWIIAMGLFFACLGYYLYRDAIREEQGPSVSCQEGTATEISGPQKSGETEGPTKEPMQAKSRQSGAGKKGQGGKGRKR